MAPPSGSIGFVSPPESSSVPQRERSTEHPSPFGARSADGAPVSRSREHAAAMLPRFDMEFIKRVHDRMEPLLGGYFRSEVRGLQRVPDEQTLLVSNHDGGLYPIDGFVFARGWHSHFGFSRPLRVLMHEIPFQFRPLGKFLHGIGCISCTPDNTERVFDAGQSALLFPGAAREVFRPWSERANVNLGGRTGFIKRALRHGIPVTPVSSAGAHEMMMILWRGEPVARWLGIKKHWKADAWPLVAGLPWGLWFGPMVPYFPLPTKIVMEIQEPVRFERVLGRAVRPEDADDPAIVQRCFEAVCDPLAAGVRRLYAQRRFPVIG